MTVNATGVNGIEITSASATVDLADFGITFATPYASTGHAIYAVPPMITAGGYANGLSGSRWSNIKVYGHDGDHYAFYLRNPIYNTFDHLRSYGGGVLLADNDSGLGGHYGNLVLGHLYGYVFVGGRPRDTPFQHYQQAEPY